MAKEIIIKSKKEFNNLVQSLVLEEQEKLQTEKITLDNIFEHFSEAEVRQAIQEVKAEMIEEVDDMSTLKQARISGSVPKKFKKATPGGKQYGTKQAIGNSLANASFLKGKPHKAAEVNLETSKALGKLNHMGGKVTDESSATAPKFSFKKSKGQKSKPFRNDTD